MARFACLHRSRVRSHAPLSSPGSRTSGGAQVVFMDGVAGGVAGDMILAAFVDLGVPVAVIQDAIDALNLGEESPRIETVTSEKSGVVAAHVEVVLPDASLRNRFRNYRQIKAMILESASKASDTNGGSGSSNDDRALSEDGDHHDHHHTDNGNGGGGLSMAAAEIALRAFEYLAIAEASCHGMPIDDVHFHEVGALDSIADIVGSAACADYLGASTVIGSPLPMGRGIIYGAAHGPLPNPAPATLGIICKAKIPTFGTEENRELVTPSGAAILAALCHLHGYQRWPEITPVQYGFGAGRQNFLSRPNLLRIVIGTTSSSSSKFGEDLSASNTVAATERDKNGTNGHAKNEGENDNNHTHDEGNHHHHHHHHNHHDHDHDHDHDHSHGSHSHSHE